MRTISHTDDIVLDYRKAIDAVKSLDELKAVMEDFGDLVFDAKDRVEKMNEKDFKTFLKHKAQERKGKFCGCDRTATILLPYALMKVGLVAHHFKVPSGCAYHRIKDLEPSLFKRQEAQR